MSNGILDTTALSTSIGSKEKKRLASQAWREKNREKHRAYAREYRKKHPEAVAAKNKAWQEANPDKFKEYHRKSRALNPDAYRATTMRYRAKHPGFVAFCNKTRRARRKGAEGNITRPEWEAIKSMFGDRCAKCGSKERISMDHVVPLFCGGTHTADNIQPLCVSCNSAKHVATVDYRTTSPYRCA